VRSNREWCSGHIEDAIHIPLGDLEDRASELQKGSNILVICGSGYRSSIAASLLQANGFVNIASIHGGMAAWDKRQLQAVS
jgi:hydroxyacylglutathione hydrolase